MNTIKKVYKLGLKVSAFGIMLTAMGLTSCSDFLNDQKPQGIMDDNQITNPKYVDNLIISAYAGLVTIEDMNSSFSLWNYDSRSDDAYIAGGGPSDAGKFLDLSLGTNVLSTDWIFNDIWTRLYKYLSRVSLSLDVLATSDQSNPTIQQRTAEMKFLRAYGHFQLKRLFKHIAYVNKLNMTEEDYRNLTNTEYTNDEGWQQIANDLEYAVSILPANQAEKGRPSKASAAALLAKVYLYKAYRQDDPKSNQVTEINKTDLEKVVKYTNLQEYYAGFGLEDDMHNNFRPEPNYENGKESVWAIQYSHGDDGTEWGNLNYSNRLIVPCIPNVHQSGCDFYKPSNTLVDAYITSVEGLPTNARGYEVGSTMTVDPRLFITVGVPGTPYMFNTDFMIDKTNTWSRAGEGVYGWSISLKQNVDPALIGEFLFVRDNQWASSMNRIVVRYADVLLMRAEALAQLGGHDAEAVALVNQVRNRAAGMAVNSIVSDYPTLYRVRFNVKPYSSLSGANLIKAIKTERRLELAMESERFFDLVRWGEAAETINNFYKNDGMDFQKSGHFTANKNEYLPIPHEQMAASAGRYTQNVGNW